ncbi:hypothetical protein PBAC_32580 [Pedobacter glucosidilyticus]|nr:T9SS type A sorting domain-containing protein [Pedobacter glucosidilyticus]KHJ36556.1 hypothetical protein PBAC_32580 [Pedobacter glucosidilyticus]
MKKTYLTFLGLLAATFSVQAQDPTTAIVPNTPAANVINVFSETYGPPASKFTNKAVNSGRATATDVNLGGNFIIKFNFKLDNATNVVTNYSQSEFAGTNTVNASLHNFFHIDIYNPATGGTTLPTLTIKLVDFGPDNLNSPNTDNKEGQVTISTPTPGTWGSYNITMSSFGTNLNNQRSNIGAMLITGSENSDLYVDNIYFSNVSTYTTATLPVTLTEFVAKASSNGAVLNWKTASEEKFNGFEVEHRTDNSDFKAINGAFISGGKNTYSYTHNNPVNGNNYYRLKMVDQDGTFEYSDIEVVQYGLANTDVKIQCYPNPVTEQLNIGFNASTAGEAIISLQDLQGRTISQTKVNAASGDNQAVINTSSLNKGVYLVSISLNGKVLGSQKVVK